jgi:hypothetical protein
VTTNPSSVEEESCNVCAAADGRFEISPERISILPSLTLLLLSFWMDVGLDRMTLAAGVTPIGSSIRCWSRPRRCLYTAPVDATAVPPAPYFILPADLLVSPSLTPTRASDSINSSGKPSVLAMIRKCSLVITPHIIATYQVVAGACRRDQN